MGNETMMSVRPDIRQFVLQLEQFSRKKLSYPAEVGELLQIVVQTGLTNEFDELIFQAKFLIRSREVINRRGFSAEGFEQLSAEFQTSMQKSVVLVKKLIGRAPTDVASRLNDTFLVNTSEGIDSLMNLFSDLQWIKNWQNDGLALPYKESADAKSGTGTVTALPLVHHVQKEGLQVILSRIKKSAALAGILFLFFVLVDPPVTTLGWIISLGILALLIYIVLQIFYLDHPSKQS